jgi:hypothetical protein
MRTFSDLDSLGSELGRGKVNAEVFHSLEHMQILSWNYIKDFIIKVLEEVFGLV